jgi:hypothetical protein
LPPLSGGFLYGCCGALSDEYTNFRGKRQADWCSFDRAVPVKNLIAGGGIMRKLWLTLLLLVFSLSPCLVFSGCGPSAEEKKELEQQEIEEELAEEDTEEDE